MGFEPADRLVHEPGLVRDLVLRARRADAALQDQAGEGAGERQVLRRTGTPLKSITRFSLAGGFGSGLDPVKAARIGLFPADLLPVVKVCGNLAIEGATAALFDPSFGDETDRLAVEARHIELGGDSEFSNAFIGQMSF